jgi:hypothetical protein
MSSEERLRGLEKSFAFLLQMSCDEANRVTDLRKRFDKLEEAHNFLLRAFMRLHPEHFGGLDRADPDIAFRAFARTHPEMFDDLDRVDAVLGIDPATGKPIK